MLSDAEKATLAEIAQRLGRKALEELAAVAELDTLLAWYRKLIANKFDGSRIRQRVGRPRIDQEAERLVLQMAKENPSWVYDRIVGALANLGFLLSDQTVGNILRRHGLSPAPIIRENRPSPGKTLSVHTWKFWPGRDEFFDQTGCLILRLYNQGRPHLSLGPGIPEPTAVFPAARSRQTFLGPRLQGRGSRGSRWPPSRVPMGKYCRVKDGVHG